MSLPKFHGDRPVLITAAGASGDDQFGRRRRRYLWTMAARAACVIGAAATFRWSGWLAAAFMAGALVLPWMAVLIANDRPPKEALKFRRFIPGTATSSPRELTNGQSAPVPPEDAAGEQHPIVDL